jgi:hypothetical protein
MDLHWCRRSATPSESARTFACGTQGYRFAQPLATVWQAFGLSGHRGNPRGLPDSSRRSERSGDLRDNEVVLHCTLKGCHLRVRFLSVPELGQELSLPPESVFA